MTGNQTMQLSRTVPFFPVWLIKEEDTETKLDARIQELQLQPASRVTWNVLATTHRVEAELRIRF
jgi:hypothetical protein